MRREKKIIVSLIVFGLSFLIGCKGGIEGMNNNDIEIRLKEEIREGEVRAAEAAYYLGNIRFIQLNFNEALGYYEQAVKLEPRNPRYLDAAGFVYLILKNMMRRLSLMSWRFLLIVSFTGKDILM